MIFDLVYIHRQIWTFSPLQYFLALVLHYIGIYVLTHTGDAVLPFMTHIHVYAHQKATALAMAYGF
jgi:hypothetical protein